LVTQIEHRVVGLAGLLVRGGKLRHSGWVGVMVHDAFQGRGVGRALLEAILAIADDHLGLVRVELDVVADNEGVIALYERLGFAHEGHKRQAGYRRGGYVNVLIMSRLR
jgi:putative acetyltransferase